jgi:drug/metabolite transporter (DMT)-like permease
VSDDKLRVIVLMVVAVVALTVGETLMAKAMKQTAEISGGWMAHIRGVLTNGCFWCGAFLMAAHFGMYLLALRWADLSFVLPFTALAYLSGALLAKYYLNEMVTPVRWAGAWIITLGVVLVGVGDRGPTRSTHPVNASQITADAAKNDVTSSGLH